MWHVCPMHLDLLLQLLAVPSPSRREERMVAFLAEHVRRCGIEHCGQLVSDEWSNVCIRKGRAGIVPCVAAHIDTVFPQGRIKVLQQDNIIFGVDEQGRRAGIGADDKAGVFVCLELLERFDDFTVVLFASEEIGSVGARHAPKQWFRDAGYVIEFDCPGRGLVSYSAGGTRLFANDGEFIRTAVRVMQTHGLTRWQHHPFTDVTVLRRRFGISCLNLSCGYHNWHSPTEFVELAEVKAAVDAGEALIHALGRRSYPFKSGADDDGPPYFTVTGLQI